MQFVRAAMSALLSVVKDHEIKAMSAGLEEISSSSSSSSIEGVGRRSALRSGDVPIAL